MSIKGVHKVHMLGIGGIGMSAIARYFLSKGAEVSGYDRVPSEMTAALEREGAILHFQDDPDSIPSEFLEADRDQSLVIHSLAIGKSNKELAHLFEAGYEVKDRARVLGEISREYHCIAIAGTHGKTTTACILTSLLRDCNIPCHALLGGVSADLGSNVLLEGEAQHLVVEADEYGRSFLELEPDIAVITAVEEDHLDVYGNRGALEDAFSEFQQKIDANGQLFLGEKVPEGKGVRAPIIRFGCGKDLDVRVRNLRPEEGRYSFDLHFGGEEWKALSSAMPGVHNVLDTCAAIAVAARSGAEEESVRKSLKGLNGVRRRFEFRYAKGKQVLIDDYAHHPTELEAVIGTARDLYPDRRISGIFQPHLYSRTRDHVDGFGEVLSGLDQLILLPIYPAREEAIPGISSELLLEKVNGPEKVSVDQEELLETVRRMAPEVLLVLGAGDISDEVEHLEEMMRELAEKEKEK